MQIKATVIADSVSPTGKRLTTFCLEYPRIIHSELLTHRMLSKNAASSRAIPVPKMLELVRQHPAMPSRFGTNESGMQDKGVEHTELVFVGGGYIDPRRAWEEAALSAAGFSQAFHEAGYHKQVCNRLTEAFQWMKTVMTGTEWENFFWLRNHEDADPTFEELAKKMEKAYCESKPVPLFNGEWHLPYYQNGYWSDVQEEGVDQYGFTLQDAIAISVSCCAQVSYRRLDDSVEKARMVVERLNLNSKTDPKHSSPTEHQGTPMQEGICLSSEGDWEAGVTAIHRTLGKMSGNLAGFIQYRQLITDNTKW